MTTGATLSGMPRLSGARVLVLNWRDTRHPDAGGAEQYIHQIARRWVSQGVTVTWFTARPKGMAAHEVIDGIQITRFGGPLSLYPLAALRLLRTRGKFDAVVDCQNGIPFFSPLFAGAGVPIVQVVHHVHQGQFTTRFSPAMAAVGRFLEGRASRWVYRNRPIVAVSTSTRQELRRQLKFQAPIFIVPNGTIELPPICGPREPDPTVVVVSRLVPHKRIDLLVRHLASAAPRVPRLRVEIVGDGPELPALRRLAAELGLDDVLSFHGRKSDAERDELLRRAWLAVSTSVAEGWGCSVMEAAAWGVPCLALTAPGIRDSVVDNCTGWLLDSEEQLPDALVRVLSELADDDRAGQVAASCRTWAGCFSWERSAALLAGVLEHAPCTGRGREHRTARADAHSVVRFVPPPGLDVRTLLRGTDEVRIVNGRTHVLLGGCDEFDAAELLARHGIHDAEVALAGRLDLLTGPGTLPSDRLNSTAHLVQAGLGREAP